MVSAFSVVDAPARGPARRTTGGDLPPRLPPPGGDGDGPDREPDPRRPILDNARLATLFLIVAEVMLFAGLVSGFFVLRLGAPVWPPPLEPRLPVAATAVNTLVLLASSVAMLAARRALAERDLAALARRVGVTAALGALFLTVQGFEWVRLVRFGLTVSSGAYGSTFYTLIGAHALHVLVALLWVLLTLQLIVRGRFSPDRPGMMRACAMYWHFVVLLWPVLYVTVYLL
ncbi:MAG: heme-copper oxidase subunit III [Candidatus Rokubacteria bacterium]|nr:heme-copper oxidase subunit III [Candidatus Rokubacteria bacterium]